MDLFFTCPVAVLPYVVEFATTTLGNLMAFVIPFGTFYCLTFLLQPKKSKRIAVIITLIFQTVGFILDIVSIVYLVIDMKSSGLKGWDAYQCLGLMVFNGRLYCTWIGVVATFHGMMKIDEKIKCAQDDQIADDGAYVNMEVNTDVNMDKEDKKQKDHFTMILTVLLLTRFSLSALILAPFIATNVVPGFFLTFLFSLPFFLLCWCYNKLLDLNGDAISDANSAGKCKKYVTKFLGIVLFIIFLVIVHSIFQGTIIIYSTKFQLYDGAVYYGEFEARSLARYMQSDLDSPQHQLFLLHTFV